MSEKIQLTIAMSEAVKINVTHDVDETLMSTLQKERLISGSFCGGLGKCGRCRVQFLQGAPLPVSTERMAFTPDELRQGYRLACMAKPKSSCVIRLDFTETQKIDIITDMMEMSGDFDFKSQEIGLTGYVIAVDLGTTTIAMQLTDIENGAVLDTYCALNPQRSYGADVLSRIRAAGMGHAKELQNSVWKILQEGIERFREILSLDHLSQRQQSQVWEAPAPPDAIRCMCIAGNTTMEHLLMGLPTESLGRSPFTPVEIGLQECRMPEGGIDASFPVYLTPGISAFVGGDIVAGLYHCGLLTNPDADSHHPVNPNARPTASGSLTPLSGSAALFIDLGTNGEMAITDGRRMLVTATAAGPAFEGGAGASVQGSDMIALTASLLKQHIIDETGLLAEPYFEKGITLPVSGRYAGKTEEIYLTQKDIRDLQMAKAAVRAGVEILCEKMDFPEITQVYLAGGFGYYLDADAAMTVGLLPENMRKKICAVGNTSLAGAFKIGRDLTVHALQKEAFVQRLGAIESVNLAEQRSFEALYLGYLNFPVSS